MSVSVRARRAGQEGVEAGNVREGGVVWVVFEGGSMGIVGLGVNGNWVDWGEGHTYRQT